MKKDKQAHQALLKVAELYGLDKRALAQAAPHLLTQTLERNGYRWTGGRWHLPERPWMLPYRTPATAEIPPLPEPHPQETD